MTAAAPGPQQEALAALLRGSLDKALALLDQAPVPQDDAHASFADGLRALILATAGQHRRADEILDRTPERPEPGWAAAPAALAAAYISIAEGAPDLAEKQLSQLRLEGPAQPLWPLEVDQWARIRLYYRTGPAVEHVLSMMRSRQEQHPTSDHRQLHLSVRAAGLALLEDSPAAAEEHLKHARSLDYQGRRGLTLERWEAMLLLHEERWDEAVEFAERLMTRAMPQPREAFVLRFVLALAEHRRGRADVAREHMQATLDIGDETQLTPSLAHFYHRAETLELLEAYAPERQRLITDVREAG